MYRYTLAYRELTKMKRAFTIRAEFLDSSYADFVVNGSDETQLADARRAAEHRIIDRLYPTATKFEWRGFVVFVR